MTEPPSPQAEPDTFPRWLPALVFAVLTCLVFRVYLLSPPGSMLVGGDTIAAGVMMRSFFVEQYHALGRLPLWNPYLYGGVPTIEAGSGDILYPVSFALHMTLPLVQALAWKLILHVFLAGFSMYACARVYGARRSVAMFAGVGWLLSTNLVGLVLGGQDGKMYVITLFPGALALLVAALDRPSWLRWLWFGASAALILIAHPQLAFYAWLALGIYALVVIVMRRGEGTRPLLQRVGGGALALMIALAACAMVLLPMYLYLRDVSPRAGPGLSYETAASYAINPEEVVNFVVPDFTGISGNYWGRNPLKENLEYGGVVIFALGLAGLFALKGDRRRLGLGIMAGVSLLYALGATTPVFRLMYLTVPGLKRFRAPSLATFIMLTAMALLAVLLLERILRDRNAPEGRIAGRVLAVLAGLVLLLGIALQSGGAGALSLWFGIFGTPQRVQALPAQLSGMVLSAILSAVWLGIAWGALLAWRRGVLGATGLVLSLTAVTAVDLLRVDSHYVTVAPYDQFFPADPGLESLRQLLQPGERVLPGLQTMPGGGREGGYLATYRIPEVFGYHSNQLRWYDQLTRRSERDGVHDQATYDAYWGGLIRSPALRALAARVLIMPTKVTEPGFELLGQDGRVAIYRNTQALPGASIVPTVRVEPDSSRTIGLLWDPAFDAAKEALVAAPVSAIGAGGGTGSARILLDGADSVSVEATTSGPSMLLLSRTFHPSWQVTVDGQRTDPIRTDHALIGVPLAAAGAHKVEFAYRPAIVATSRSISLAAWALILLATLGSWGMSIRQRRTAHG